MDERLNPLDDASRAQIVLSDALKRPIVKFEHMDELYPESERWAVRKKAEQLVLAYPPTPPRNYPLIPNIITSPDLYNPEAKTMPPVENSRIVKTFENYELALDPATNEEGTIVTIDFAINKIKENGVTESLLHIKNLPTDVSKPESMDSTVFNLTIDFDHSIEAVVKNNEEQPQKRTSKQKRLISVGYKALLKGLLGWNTNKIDFRELEKFR